MKEVIDTAIETLKKGGIILYPTDTVWGIGCDATNPDAVAKIYALKKREDSKSMIVVVHNDGLLQRCVRAVPDQAWQLIDVSDKPLTLVLDGAQGLASNLVATDGSIAIRRVNHAFCQALLSRFNKPIVSTSANVSGNPSPSSFQQIDPQIIAGVDFVVPREQEGAPTGQPSSIIKLALNGQITIIRK
ncbi:MAG TPA: L-threonylcarbamoyladenylate synthase [Luteibaculaceae bacterium]|nr:L-threonylcarbamoyladenylate synthase [Luteibaculaceae bacterium]